MNNVLAIIKTTVGQENIETVNARDLHKVLNSKQEFSHWIKARITKFDFEEGVDYCTSNLEMIKLSNQVSHGGARTTIEYHISIDMAKELAMVENNEEGKATRKWFIERDKQLSKNQLSIPTNFSEALKLAYEQSVVIETQKLQLTAASIVIESMQPAQTFVENFVRNDKSMTLTQAWKGLGLQPNKFNEQLRKDGILYNKGTSKNVSSQQHLQAGHFTTKITEFGNQTLVQPKGIVYISKKYAEYIEQHSIN